MEISTTFGILGSVSFLLLLRRYGLLTAVAWRLVWRRVRVRAG